MHASLLAAILLGASAASAQPIATLPDHAHWTVLGITLNDSTPTEITQTFGGRDQRLQLRNPSAASESHDATDEYAYCPSTDPTVRLVFRTGRVSNPEVFEYELRKLTPNSRLHCLPSPALVAAPRTNGGVQLGMTTAEFRRLFPGEPRAEDRRLSYQFEQATEYAPPKPSPYNPANKLVRETTTATVEGTFENGRLARFRMRAYTEAEFE